MHHTWFSLTCINICWIAELVIDKLVQWTSLSIFYVDVIMIEALVTPQIICIIHENFNHCQSSSSNSRLFNIYCIPFFTKTLKANKYDFLSRKCKSLCFVSVLFCHMFFTILLALLLFIKNKGLNRVKTPEKDWFLKLKNCRRS